MSWIKSSLIAALLLTCLGSQMPIVIDEAIYAQYAAQIAADPADPYGFEVFWYDAPSPANEVVVPPGMPYWLGSVRSLLGDSVFAWRLGMFPVGLLFCGALGWLLRRFAPGTETPLLFMAVLSPSVLPSFNLMLDIPMLSLALLGVALFVRACDEGRWGPAAAAGVAIGLAIQTKYSGLLALAPIALYGLLLRRIGFAALAVLIASTIFTGWELLMAARYGRSHFLHGMEVVEEHFSEGPALLWLLAFLSLIGTLLPAVGLLALGALPRLRRFAIGAAPWVLMIFAGLPLLARSPIAAAGYPYGSLHAPHPEVWLFTPLGVVVLGVLGLLVHRTWRDGSDRDGLFLMAWLACEIAGFFLLSPFPATRRVIGISLVATLIAGRLLARDLDDPAARRGTRAAVAVSIALGALMLFSGHSDAIARRSGVALAQRTLAAQTERCATTWYVGHWGFQFEAERAGMRAVIPGMSALRAGDCLVHPYGVDRQRIRLGRGLLERIDVLEIESISPWSTIPYFYVGPVPLRAQPEKQLEIVLYRVTRDHVPAARS